MAEYWAHVERDADSLRGEERMHLGVAAQCEGANLVRLERIEGEGADKGHVHTQGAVLPSALYAQQGAIRDRDPGRVFQQRLAPGPPSPRDPEESLQSGRTQPEPDSLT